MSKTPTAKEITKSFCAKCGFYPYHHHPCHICRYYKTEDDWNECLVQYTMDILTGEISIGEDLTKPEVFQAEQGLCRVRAGLKTALSAARALEKSVSPDLLPGVNQEVIFQTEGLLNGLSDFSFKEAEE